MKKTLTKKIIKGKEYFYLVYRKNGVLKSQYLGGASSAKYKKYLFKLTAESGSYGIDKARHKNFSKGVPIVYVENGFLVDEYKNGTKEYLNNKLQVVKVVAKHD